MSSHPELSVQTLNPLIHELARLRICSALAATTALESRVLRDVADLSESALSKHLKRLTEAGYVKVQTGEPQGPGRPPAWISLTDIGRNAFVQHMAALNQMASPT
ncbi:MULTISPECIES: transcriptional regulator [unclassified Cryobacterium]|uniref:transcriptional regulator n=1 Tax=unclassified Cryobacterium TaxID=2649013 RepID=UPI00141B0084|nr:MULTISPECIES: transcriptional regulator [unclassified Cryobacterium]